MALESTVEINDAAVLAIAEQLYRQRPEVERLSVGVNMHVYALAFAEPTPERVIKLAGAETWKPWAVLDEIAAMRALRREGIHEVPEIERTHEDPGWSTVPFLVTRRMRPGLLIENVVRRRKECRDSSVHHPPECHLVRSRQR